MMSAALLRYDGHTLTERGVVEHWETVEEFRYDDSVMCFTEALADRRVPHTAPLAYGYWRLAERHSYGETWETEDNRWRAEVRMRISTGTKRKKETEARA